MPKLRVIESANQDVALQQIIAELGVAIQDVRFVSTQNRKHTFEILSCPAKVQFEISKDGMKAFLKKVCLPIGPNQPAFNVQFVFEEITKAGITHGVKRDVVSSEIFKILKNPKFDETMPLQILIAEGQPAINGKAAKSKYTFDPKIFDKPDPVYIKKGEVLASAAEAEAARDGVKVTGEVIPATLEEQGKLPVGSGIKSQRVGSEIHYIAETSGRLYFDQGIRLRIDPKLITLDEGMTVAVTIQRTTLRGQTWSAQDLMTWAESQGVRFGMLSAAEIDQQIKGAKKWPLQITLARGQQPSDGKPGAIKYLYREPKSQVALDIDRVKAGIVFPGEVLVTIEKPSDPIPGQTPFGEILRAKPYLDLPIYPGKNIAKEKIEEKIVFKATAYGKVSIKDERVNVDGILRVSQDKMQVFADVFPQQLLTSNDFVVMLREADVLVAFDKDDLDKRLAAVVASQKRQTDFIVVQGIPPRLGKDASLVYRFDPNHFKDKGLFQKKTDPLLLAYPGDLLITKIEPLDAQPGQNVYRERIEVSTQNIPKDVEINPGKNIEVKRLGRDTDPKDPPRIEYRAARYGVLIWKDLTIDIQPAIEIDKEEKSAWIQFSPTSDFGSRMTLELLKQIAESEAIKTELATKVLEGALAQPRSPDRSLKRTLLAEAIPVKHGDNSQIEYLVEINDSSVADLVGGDAKAVNVNSADCVRPGDVLAVKTPATLGEDGKTIFGKRIPADRGRDEPWFVGEGIGKSQDQNQIICQTKGPGFVFPESGRLVVRSTVKIAQDKMSATVSLYPSKNPRFQLREDKILSMLEAAGVRSGIRRELIRSSIQKVVETQKPLLDVVVAEGQESKKGSDASYIFAVDVGQTVGEVRDDGSVDFKSRHIFQNVRKGQVLVIRRPPTPGEDGINVLGEKVPSRAGTDQRLDAREGVEIDAGGVDYRAKIDGIVEFKGRTIRVIPGLWVPDDVNFKTGHIQAESSDVFIKGGVLPDFIVKSRGSIIIEKAAEACQIDGGKDVSIRGGIIGKDRGRVIAGGNLETQYISGGATVEVRGDLIVGNEILNSQIRVIGKMSCLEGAGTIAGGEIWAYSGLICKSLGSPGAEMTIYLGEHFFDLQAAKKKIAEAQFEEKISELENKIKELSKDLSLILSERETSNLGAEIQDKYHKAMEEKKRCQAEMDILAQAKVDILAAVPQNDQAIISVKEVLYPGVTIKFRNVTWTLKGELRGVEVFWDKVTSNLVSRRLT